MESRLAEENETRHIRKIYMNMNGRGKRKRDQAMQGDTHSRDTDDTDEKRESRKPKQTESRLTEATKLKGIG